MTPPDGQNGRCRMYLWNTANPYRDGDLEAGIVIHELSHGLSTRLTGGPSNSGCLGWGESGGMGEGWGGELMSFRRSCPTIFLIWLVFSRLPRNDDPQYKQILRLPHGRLGRKPRERDQELPILSKQHREPVYIQDVG